MNKNILIGGLVVVVLGAGLVVANQQAKPEKTTEAWILTQSPMVTTVEDAKTSDTETSGRYVEYSKSTFDQASSTRRVLFFYASFCSICRPADANFKSNTNKIPSDVTVIRVNYNDPDTDQEEKDLAKKYSVVYQHTFVQIDQEGKVVTRWNGGQIQELLANIK